MSEGLIGLVRQQPLLYDTSHPDYMKKTLKDSIWERIAKEANYSSGSLAKAAWMKLRNCHRDALRRKISKSGSTGSVPKPWRYENQMRFLIKFMTKRPNATKGPSDSVTENEELSGASVVTASEDNDNKMAIQSTFDMCGTVKESIQTGNFMLEREEEDNYVSDCDERDNGLVKRGNLLQNKTQHINDLLIKTLINHEERVQEMAVEKQRKMTEDRDDELLHFFMSMYGITKKMPLLNQHRLRRKIFDAISNEEELLLSGMLGTNHETQR